MSLLTQRFLVFTNSYPDGWEYGTYERAKQVAALIGPRGKVRVEVRQRDDKGVWGWVHTEGPRKPQETPYEDQATPLPDEPTPPAQPQKKRAGVKSKSAGRSSTKPKRGRVK